MGITAAAVAASAAAVAGGVGSGLAASKGSKNKTTASATPQTQSIQQIVSRLLLQRYAQGPQTFGQYRAEGPRENPEPVLNAFEAQALGFADPRRLHFRTPEGARINPSAFTLDQLLAIQQQGSPEALLNTLYNPDQRAPNVGSMGGTDNSRLWGIQGGERVFGTPWLNPNSPYYQPQSENVGNSDALVMDMMKRMFGGGGTNGR